MEMHQLRYFVAVAEQEHFRRASDELHIAQPAISRQIRLLEKELGVTLFDRTPTGARLTEVGRVFLLDAKRILASVVEAAERARRAASGQALRLCISFTSSPPGVVPESILAFQVARPEVGLVLLSIDSPKQLQGLRDKRIDAAFLNFPARDDTEFAAELVQVENVVLALPGNHRLSAAAELHLRDLAEEPLILFARDFNPRLYDELLSVFARGGLVPRIVQEVNTSAVIVDLVSFGFGLGIVTTAMRGRLPAGVVLRPVADLSVPYQLDLVWCRDNTSLVRAAFVETVRATCRR